jgi:hypothetical protein
MKPKIIVIISAIFLLLLVLGCKKKSTNSENGCLSKLDFTKITYTNDVGDILMNDPTDWTNDSAWCQEEYNLFNTANLDLTGSDTNKIFTFLFPNPVATSSCLILIGDKICPVQYVIVNRSFQILDTFSIHFLGSGNVHHFIFFSDSLKYKHGEFYRIYYAAHCTRQLFFYKGHGDFQIE